jgi:GAF domain-containing protein
MLIQRAHNHWTGLQGTAGEVIRPSEVLCRPVEVAGRIQDLIRLTTRYSNVIDWFERILAKNTIADVLTQTALAAGAILKLPPSCVRIVVAEPRKARLLVVDTSNLHVSDAFLLTGLAPSPPQQPRESIIKGPSPRPAPVHHSFAASPSRTPDLGFSPVGSGLVPLHAVDSLIGQRTMPVADALEHPDGEDDATSPRHAPELEFKGGNAAAKYMMTRSVKPSTQQSATDLTAGDGAMMMPSISVEVANGRSTRRGVSIELASPHRPSSMLSESGSIEPEDWALDASIGLTALQTRILSAVAEQKMSAFAHDEEGSTMDTCFGETPATARDSSPPEPSPDDGPVRSVLAVPLVDHDNRGAFRGILEVHSSKADRFCASDKHVLEALAATASRCIHSVGLLGAAKHAYRRTNQLLTMLQHSLSADDLEEVVKRIVTAGYKLVNSERMSVFLVDHEAEELVIIVSEDAAGLRIPISSGLAGAVVASGEPLNLVDAYEDERFSRAMDEKTGFRTKSILVVPVFGSKGEIIAVIQAINKRDAVMFNQEDLSMLRAVASAAAVALTHAGLLLEAHEEKERALALVDAATIVEDAERRQLDLHTMLHELVTRVARRLVPSDKTTLFLVDELKGELVFRVTQDAGEGLQDLRIPIGHGIAGTVAQSGKAENIPDAYEDARFSKEVDRKTGFRTKSMLVVPIREKANGRVVAVLQAINKRGGGRFTTTDEQLFAAFAQNVASSIANRVMQAAYDRVLGGGANSEAGGDLESAVERSLLSQFMNQGNSQLAPIVEGGTKRSRRKSLAVGGPSRTTSRPLAGLSTQDSASRLSPTTQGLDSGRSRSRRFSATRASDDGSASVSSSSKPALGESLRGRDFTELASSSMVSGPSIAESSLSTPVTPGHKRMLSSEAPPVGMSAEDWAGHLIGGVELRSRELTLPEGPVPFRGGWAERMVELSFDTLAESHADLARCVVDMCYSLGLVQTFDLDSRKLLRYANELSLRYLPNPYHNFQHGVSVAHVSFFIVQRCSNAQAVLKDIDRLALILGAASHDVEHPGWNNAFEVATGSALALRYNDVSVLENHHAATMFRLLEADGTDVVADLEHGAFLRFRKVALSGILATDMAHHQKLVENARKLNTSVSESFPADEVSNSCHLVEFIMHTSDICNPALPSFPVVVDWAIRVCTEFTNQAEKEKSLGMTPLPHMLGLEDEHTRAKSQVFFATGVIRPLYAAMAVFLPELREAVDNIDRNVASWKDVVAKTAPEASPAK